MGRHELLTAAAAGFFQAAFIFLFLNLYCKWSRPFNPEEALRQGNRCPQSSSLRKSTHGMAWEVWPRHLKLLLELSAQNFGFCLSFLLDDPLSVCNHPLGFLHSVCQVLCSWNVNLKSSTWFYQNGYDIGRNVCLLNGCAGLPRRNTCKRNAVWFQTCF